MAGLSLLLDVFYSGSKLTWVPTRMLRTQVMRDMPIIKVPIKLQDKIRKFQKKMALAQAEKMKRLSRRGNLNEPIVTCRKTDLNFYKGQTYSKFEVKKIASQGWLNRRAAGDHFMIHPVDDLHPAFLHQEKSNPTFEKMKLRPEIYDNLKDMNISVPSNIQALAIPHIMSGQNTMCAAETGSGKTLAYLLPIVHNILSIKEVDKRSEVYNSPLAVILVPNRELAKQIFTVASKLTKSMPVRNFFIVGGDRIKRKMLKPRIHEVDILIATIGAIKKLVSSGIYSLSKINHVVVDEADTLLDDSFNDMLLSLLKKIKFRDCVPSIMMNQDVGAQLTLMGATLPSCMEVILQDVVQVNTIKKLTTHHLHHLMSHVPQTFLRLKKSEKPAKLLEIVKKDVKQKRPVMIFCKNTSTADYVEMFLKENGVKAVHHHSRMRAFWRQDRLNKFQNGVYDVISCTDIASRGIDTARVQHIINYDFPIFVSDYIHRVGRTGRLSTSGSGRVTSFIATNDEVELVQKVEMAARNMTSLKEVNANIKGQILKKMGILEDDDFL